MRYTVCYILQRSQGKEYEYQEDVALESYVNTMCSTGRQTYFIGGKKGYLVKVSHQ